MQVHLDIFSAEKEIPGNDSVRLIEKIVEEMDISSLMSTYKRTGRPTANSAAVMLAVILYANMEGKYWTEEQSGQTPYDRRGLATVGPFSFGSGTMQELDYAMVTVWRNDNLSALERKGVIIDHIRALFNNGFGK